MRHRPALTPTMRLIIHSIQNASNQALSQRDLAEQTGASFYTITKATQKMVRNGYLIRSITDDYTRVFTLALPEAK